MSASVFNQSLPSNKRRHDAAFAPQPSTKARTRRRPRRRPNCRSHRSSRFSMKLDYSSRPPPRRAWKNTSRHSGLPDIKAPEAKRRCTLHQIKTETIDIPNRVITSPDDLSVVETREIFRILDAGLRAGFGVPVYTADVMGAFLRAVFDSGYWSPGDSGNRREIPDIWLPFAAVTFSPAVACTGRLVPDQDPFGLPHDFIIQPQITIDLVPTPRFWWSFICHGLDISKSFTLTREQIAAID